MTSNPRAVPPQSFFSKLAFYSSKYGFLHAICSYLGRHSGLLWQVLGPLVTGPYRVKATKQPKVIINLGGGSNCLVGCLTADVDPRADCYVDGTKPLPFPGSSVHGVFCEEFLEHISEEEGRALLAECYRILVPGGVIRLTTPNLDWFARLLVDGVDMWREVNSIFYDHGHKCLYSTLALKTALSESGFEGVQHSTYQDPQSVLGHLDSHADRYKHPAEMSQYIEGMKPLRVR
jgi:predicted SAM-dependent methyltransferase